MNFFEYQESARRRTQWLIAYYVLAVFLIILALYIVAALIFHYGEMQDPGGLNTLSTLYDPTLFGMVALATGALILGGSLFKITTLAAGGEAVARMLEGRPIPPNTTQFQEKRLLNIVEEMAIASGTPVPRVFLLDHEEAINAFAAGFSPKDAVIGVTRGALEKLTREELQGVIGHEFSHILNGDMRLNIRLIGVLHGILVIALTGTWILRILGRSRSSGYSRGGKKGNPLAAVILLGIAMIIIGYIGVFFARLIKSAVSRQREFLADASAVQFTRNPSGLANALKKIGTLITGSQLQTASAEAASHLFFANGIGASFLGLLATHPPLEERIRRLDPQFTGEFESPATALPAEPDIGVSQISEAGSQIPPPLPTMEVTPDLVTQTAGTLSSAALAGAANTLEQVAAPLLDAVHSPHSAQTVVFGLLLDRDPAIRQRQLNTLANQSTPERQTELDTLIPHIDALSRQDRPPLASLATASLKHLPREEYLTFRETVTALAAADSEISLFEYMILRMLVRTLDPQFGLAKRPRPHITTFGPLTGEVSTVLSALAWFGTQDPGAAAMAFAAGCRELGHPELTLLPPEQASLTLMDTALDRLSEAVAPLKQKLIAAFTATISTDGTITPDEAEALRAAADALDCPLPPFQARIQELKGSGIQV